MKPRPKHFCNVLQMFYFTCNHRLSSTHEFNMLKACVMHILSAHCSIEVLAYGGNDNKTPRYGYVKLNAVPEWQASWKGSFPNHRGVNVFLVDPFRCSVRESRSFDTWGDANAATELSNYIQQVNRGGIIVGVSADDASRFLASALDTLREIGVDVADVQFRGSFGFVAQKGFPAKTVLRKVLTQADSNANQPHFNVTVTGTIYYTH